MPIVPPHGSKSAPFNLPVSILAAAGMLAVGLVVMAFLIGSGVTLRPANFPGIGMGTNVGSGYSLGLGWVVEARWDGSVRVAYGILAFWAYVAVMLCLLLLSPAEWAFRRGRRP